MGLHQTPLFEYVAYAEVISKGYTSDVPKAIASTARIDVVKFILSAILATTSAGTSSCTILTEIKFIDFFNPSLKVVNPPVEPS